MSSETASPAAGTLGVPKQAYRVKEAMQALGLSRSKLYEQMRARRLRSVKCGSARLIPVDAVREFLDLLRREADDDL
jgi:excisionase family DNA binding protein